LPQALAIGIHTNAGWTGPDALLVGGETLRVRHCASSLALREELLLAEEGARPVVILTPLTDMDLEADVRARLARGRLLTVKIWDVVRDAFQLRDIDARLVDKTWMADLLLELHGEHPDRVVASGFLDADTAWDLAAERLGLPSGRPDALELLRWAHRGAGEAVHQLAEEKRTALQQRCEETAGPVAGPLLPALLRSPQEAVPLGLVCSVLFSPDARDEERTLLSQAAVRLEPLCGGRPVTAAAGQAWARAAEAVAEDAVGSGGLEGARNLLQNADALLEKVQAAECAYLGRYSLLGFEQLLERFGSALDACVTGPSSGSVDDALEALRQHGLASAQASRLRRCEMAARLVHWLPSATPPPAPGSFLEAAKEYAAEGGCVDWVRSALELGDGCRGLSEAFGRLLARVGEVREKENAHFGRLLANWVASGNPGDSALPVEAVLARVVGPLAEQAPVLLLVLDGMSVAVFRELAQDLTQQGWVELLPEGRREIGPAIAAFPTVTEVSRASLLCGKLTSGAANVERAGFSSHELLRQRASSRKPPVVYHKGDLAESTEPGLAPEVRHDLEDPERRIAAVVVNAIDDHLAKGDQLRPVWSIETIRPLRGLLHACQQAGRVVVITSDHGHVLERGGTLHSYADAERWRADDGAPVEGEVVVAGPRVVLPPSKRLIAPWTEGLRYGQKKNGYHGGVSPEEVVIPIGVFSIDGPLEGWVEVGPRMPAWWTSSGAAPTTTPAKAKPRRRGKAAQKTLFDESHPEADRGWLEELFVSQTWKDQTQAASRLRLEEALVRSALAAFQGRGGRLTRNALAHELDLPLVRLGGVITALRRVLNVDGYEVLEVDAASDTLILNEALLRKQFDLA
jgi:hypothetical protein